MNAVSHYLHHHAEAETQYANFIRDDFSHALVIPSYAEGQNLLHTVTSVAPAETGKVLILIVINEPDNACETMKQANQLSCDSINDSFPMVRQLTDDLTLHPHPAGSILLLQRRRKQALPHKQGVGLARKIGADMVLAISKQQGESIPYIHMTDADATLPKDYFSQLSGAREATALLFPFYHTKSPQDDDAIFSYEVFLRYYVLGLRFANSPYAYHSLGSCMAVSTEAYAKVRGVPKRAAGEDFYLLNKLRKLGPLITQRGEAIQLSGRRSKRTPFGTGHALATSSQPRTAYHPKIFALLRSILAGIEHRGKPEQFREYLRVSLPPEDAERVLEAFDQLKIDRAFRHALQYSSTDHAFAQRIHEYFDAFRTLKLIHMLRKSGLYDFSLQECLRQAEFVPGNFGQSLDWQQKAQALAQLEQETKIF